MVTVPRHHIIVLLLLLSYSLVTSAGCTRARRHHGVWFPSVNGSKSWFSLNAAILESVPFEPQLLPPTELSMPLNAAGRQAQQMVAWMLDCELFMLRAFMPLFASKCSAPPITHAHHNHPTPFFIDAGANEGTWSVLAAAMGCRVLAVEPQPGCRGLMSKALSRNLLSDRVLIVPHLLAAEPMNATLDGRLCQGDREITENTAHRSALPVQVSSIRLDSLQQLWLPSAEVFLWHIDVEGAEILVLRSAKALLRSGRIRRVMVELLFHNWPAFGFSVETGLAELRTVFAGWACVVGCNGLEYRFNSSELGACTSANSRFSRSKPSAPDVFCTSP